MSRTCTKCKVDIPDSEQLEPQAEKYPTCNKCWEEWKEMRIMVMNEMHLDMSLADHRKVLRKHEKMFAGVMTPEGDYIDYTNEDNRFDMFSNYLRQIIKEPHRIILFNLDGIFEIFLSLEVPRQQILIKSIKSAFDSLDEESKRKMILLTPESCKNLFGF